MPWSPSSAKRHTRKAKSPKQQRQWSYVANAVRKQTGSDARAIRAANSVVRKTAARSRTRRASGR